MYYYSRLKPKSIFSVEVDNLDDIETGHHKVLQNFFTKSK